VNGRLYDLFSRRTERRGFGDLRRDVVGSLDGNVLELGAGTGLNLPHYAAGARVVAVEPDDGMASRLETRAESARVPVDVVRAPAERLPFADASFDHVVSTVVLCSVESPAQALAEARRVLRPGGDLRFVEHVRARGRRGAWQDRLTPLQRRFVGNCHLNRETVAEIEAAGFRLEDVAEVELPGFCALAKPVVRGRAVV
jgi:ubiquinone/menaquinone biosynthesis C-methylase UbiE